MTYGQSGGYNSGSSYGGNQGGGYQQNRNNSQGGGYQKSQYQRPPQKEFNLDDECEKYAVVYKALCATLEARDIALADVKDYLGGWTTSLKINLDKQ